MDGPFFENFKTAINLHPANYLQDQESAISHPVGGNKNRRPQGAPVTHPNYRSSANSAGQRLLPFPPPPVVPTFTCTSLEFAETLPVLLLNARTRYT